KSSASVSVLNVDGRRARLQPPTDLTADETALFREIVNSCKPEHFVQSDRPLLVALCQAILMSREAARGAAKDPKLAQAVERAARTMATLATRLRLTPQSRFDSRRAARNVGQPPPWLYDRLRGDQTRDDDNA